MSFAGFTDTLKEIGGHLVTVLAGSSQVIDHIHQAHIDIERGADAAGARETALQAIFRDVPEFVGALGSIASFFFPAWGGTAVKLLAFLVDHSAPMNAAEEAIWMDRQNTTGG